MENNLPEETKIPKETSGTKHRSVILIALAVVVAIALAMLFGGLNIFLDQSGGLNELNNSVFPSSDNNSGGVPILGADMVLMTRVDGVTQRVHDIRRDPKTKAFENGTYVFYEGGASKNKPDFRLIYIEKSHSFAVSLLTAPLHERRLEAETILLDRLQVNEEELCNMRVMVSTTKNVSAVFASRELGLSFCEGGVPLD